MKWLIALIPLWATASGCIPVNGEKILAGDMARAIPDFGNLDPLKPIGFSPLPGSRRLLTLREIRFMAHRFGITTDYPANICFERSSQHISPDLVRKAIAQSLSVEEDQVEVMDVSRAAIPPGNLDFPISGAVRPAAASPDRAFLWRGRLVSEDRTYPTWAVVRISTEKSVVVAAVALHRGQLITSDLVRTIPAKVSHFDSNKLSDPAVVIGKLVKHDVASGQTILATDLENPKEVKQGDLVRVAATSGEAMISFEAKAQTGGRLGDNILVQNPTNGRTFRAKVVGKERVECDSSHIY